MLYNFHLKAQILSLATNMMVFLGKAESLGSFLRECQSNAHVRITTVFLPVIPSGESAVP